MGTPFIEQAADEFDITDPADWKELLDSASFPSSTHMSNDVQEATLVGLVPWNKQRSAERWFLGFAWADDFVPYRLYRENPQFHPIKPQLRAYDVTCVPFIPKSNPDENKPKIASPWDPDLYTAYAEHVLMTVRYRNFRMRFRVDADIAEPGDEWKRNVVYDLDPQLDVLTADGVSQLKFCEGAVPPAGPNGTAFPAPVGVLQGKVGYTFRWMNVPINYISTDTDIFYPEKILGCVGKVNDDTFLGKFPKATMLMLAPKFTFKPAVVPDEYGEPIWLVDADLNFSYFAPPKIPALVASAFQGHQIMPWRRDGYYYGARRDDGSGELLQYADFDTIFEHVFFS